MKVQSRAELSKLEWRIRRLIGTVPPHSDGRAFLEGAQQAILWMLSNSPNLKQYIQDQEDTYNLPPIGKGER